jgi:lantibiotic modifying enzyme
MLSLIITRLEEEAQHSSEGTSWLAPVNDGSRPGDFNLGMAHGIPGVVALLARAVAARVERKRAFALLSDSVRWLRVQRLPQELGGGFPATISRGESPAPTRVAWCYGDPGVAAALLAAAKVLEQPDLEKEAIDLAVSAAARPLSESLIADAGICHGAAGVGQLYNRFFQMTGHPALGKAARDFFAQAIELRRPGTGIAGYAPAPAPGSEDTSGIDQKDAGLITGAAGIALALLSAISPVAPEWDRIFFMDLQVRAGSRAGKELAGIATKTRLSKTGKALRPPARYSDPPDNRRRSQWAPVREAKEKERNSR